MSYQPGDVVGSYRILGVIGAGGMGRVYRVEHTVTGRVEAMKVLLRDRAAEPELVQRFLREIRIQASLSHPNIAAVHNAFAAGDDLVLVMELVEGEPLDRRNERGPLPWREAAGYACQALAALDHAHGRGVTHRDVKPANMIVTPEGTLKLTDFGLAVIRTADPRLSRSGAPMGSVHYMSPEQVKALPTVDARSDIYSVGAVLYELVTGCKPFPGDSPFDVMRAQVEEAARPPIELTPGLPRALNDAVQRAMAKKPEDRFSSAEEFRVTLADLEAASRWPSRRRAAATLAGVAALVAIAVTVTLRRNPSAPAPARPAARLGPRTILIPARAVLRVETTQTLSSATHQAGNPFRGVLREPLMVEGRLIAPRGAAVEGRVHQVDPGGRIGGRAWLSVRLTDLHGAGGAVIPIVTQVIVRQSIGRGWVLRRPPAAVIPAQTALEFRVLRAAEF